MGTIIAQKDDVDKKKELLEEKNKLLEMVRTDGVEISTVKKMIGSNRYEAIMSLYPNFYQELNVCRQEWCKKQMTVLLSKSKGGFLTYKDLIEGIMTREEFNRYSTPEIRNKLDKNKGQFITETINNVKLSIAQLSKKEIDSLGGNAKQKIEAMIEQVVLNSKKTNELMAVYGDELLGYCKKTRAVFDFPVINECDGEGLQEILYKVFGIDNEFYKLLYRQREYVKKTGEELSKGEQEKLKMYFRNMNRAYAGMYLNKRMRTSQMENMRSMLDLYGKEFKSSNDDSWSIEKYLNEIHNRLSNKYGIRPDEIPEYVSNVRICIPTENYVSDTEKKTNYIIGNNAGALKRIKSIFSIKEGENSSYEKWLYRLFGLKMDSHKDYFNKANNGEDIQDYRNKFEKGFEELYKSLDKKRAKNIIIKTILIMFKQYGKLRNPEQDKSSKETLAMLADKMKKEMQAKEENTSR